MAARTIKINIKLPTGVTATPDLINKATKAADAIVNKSVQDFKEAAELARELSRKGIRMTAEEILSRKATGGRSRVSDTAKPRKRVVLSAAQKKSVVVELKKGAKAGEVAKQFGISHATVMNIKRAAGLTKKRK